MADTQYPTPKNLSETSEESSPVDFGRDQKGQSKIPTEESGKVFTAAEILGPVDWRAVR